MLHIKNLTAGYGKVNVLHGISLDVKERECVALIGANGAVPPCDVSVALTKFVQEVLNSWEKDWMV